MVVPTPAPVDGAISVLSKLASFLRQAEDVAGQINFHPSLHSAVGQLVKSSGTIPEGEIANVVQALEDGTPDDDTPGLCSRLGTKAFVLIFAVLRVSEPCPSQQRGLWLLTEALVETDSSQPNTQISASVLDNAPLLSKKARIGADILRLALKYFCNSVADARVRRWMGLLTVELVQDCKENAQLLATESEERRHELGGIIIKEKDELLRYIAGSVIRCLVCEGVATDLFWSTSLESTINGTCFEREAHDSQWLELFEEHLDEIDSQTGTHSLKVALFSHILKLGRKLYRSDSRSILVTLHGVLSIMLPERLGKSSRIERAKYVDVPLDNIIEVDIREPGVERPSISVDGHVRSFVDIHLIERDGCTFYANARAEQQPFIGLAFDTAIAEDLKRLISTQKSHIQTRKNIHKSPLNVSQVDLIRASQNQAARGAHHDILDAAPEKPGQPSQGVLKGSMHPSILHASDDDFDDDPDDVAPDSEQMLPDTTQMADTHRLIATAARVNSILSRGLPWNHMDPNISIPVSAPNPRPDGNHHQHVRVSDAGSPVKVDFVVDEADPEPRFSPASPRGQKTGEFSSKMVVDSQLSQESGDLLDQGYTSIAQWRDGVITIEQAKEFTEVVYGSYKMSNAVQEPLEQNLSAEIIEAESPQLLNGIHAVLYPDNEQPATEVAAKTNNNLAVLPSRVTASADSRKPLAPKVSQRLLGRQGQRVSPVKANSDDVSATDPRDSSKSGLRNTKKPPDKETPPHIKITYKSRHKKEVSDLVCKDSSVAPARQASVFDIPSSPTRTAKIPPKLKQTKTTATAAKPAIKKNSTQAKGKTKPPTTGSARKAATSKDASVLPVQANKDNMDDSTKQDITENEEVKKTRSSGRRGGAGERAEVSTVTKKGKASKGAAPSAAKQRSGESTVVKPNTKAPTKKRNPAPAALNRPERRRAAAINAKKKIQGLMAKADQGSQDNGEMLGVIKSSDGEDYGLAGQAEEAVQDGKAHQAEEVGQDDQCSQVDQADQAEEDGQDGEADHGVNDIGEAASGASKQAITGPKKSVDLNGDQTETIVGEDHVTESKLQPQEVPQVTQAVQTNMDVDRDFDKNVEESVTTVPKTIEAMRVVQMVVPTAETVQAAPRSPPTTIETTSAPVAGFLSPSDSVDLVKAGGRLGLSHGNVNQHAGDTTNDDIMSYAAAPLLQVVTEAAPVFSKTPGDSPEANVQNGKSKEEAISASVHGDLGVRPLTDMHPNLDSKSVAVVNKTIVTKVLPTASQTQSNPQSLCRVPTPGNTVPKANDIVNTVDMDISEDVPQVIHITSGEESSAESELTSPPKDTSKTVPTERRLNKKRKSEDILEDSVKRIRLSTPGPAQMTGPAEELNSIARDDHIQRKSVIIGFDARGPLNQGVYSGKRPRAFMMPQNPEGRVVQNTPSLSVKRKHTDDQESATQYSVPMRVVKTPAEKRRRTINEVPPTRSEYGPSLAQTSSPNVTSQPQRMTSQGSRVLDNGSPMASGDQVRRINGVNMDHLLRRLSTKEGGSLMAENLDSEEDEVESHSLWEPELPLPAQRYAFPQPASVHALKQYGRRSSSNTKAMPSSPTAPSRMLEDMTIHKLAADGRLVNVHTATVIKPAEPQDPFVDITRNLPNPFLKMLRASTKEDVATGGKGATNRHLTNRAGKDSGVPLFDPDRTLVEVETRRYGRIPSSSHGEPSSSPTSFGKRPFVPSESDKEEEREELAQLWMEALRPHQRGTLASLHEMSNRLVRHLIRKESVIDDAVKDYDLGANKLLDALKNAHSESKKNHHNSVAKAKQSLAASYGEIEKRLGQEVREVKRGRVTHLERKWKQEEQQHQEYLGAVMLAYSG